MSHVRVITVDCARDARRMAGDFVPFRAPHWTCSAIAHADELQRAAGGVLYLDEPAELRRSTVEQLAERLATADHAPLAVIVKDRNPFREDGPEPDADACLAFAKRVRWAVDRLLLGAGRRPLVSEGDAVSRQDFDGATAAKAREALDGLGLLERLETFSTPLHGKGAALDAVLFVVDLREALDLDEEVTP